MPGLPPIPGGPVTLLRQGGGTGQGGTGLGRRQQASQQRSCLQQGQHGQRKQGPHPSLPPSGRVQRQWGWGGVGSLSLGCPSTQLSWATPGPILSPKSPSRDRAWAGVGVCDSPAGGDRGYWPGNGTLHPFPIPCCCKCSSRLQPLRPFIRDTGAQALCPLMRREKAGAKAVLTWRSSSVPCLLSISLTP